MESVQERLRRYWLEIGDDRANRGLWSMSQERRNRLFSPALIGIAGPEQDIVDDYEINYKETYT